MHSPLLEGLDNETLEKLGLSKAIWDEPKTVSLPEPVAEGKALLAGVLGFLSPPPALGSLVAAAMVPASLLKDTPRNLLGPRIIRGTVALVPTGEGLALISQDGVPLECAGFGKGAKWEASEDKTRVIIRQGDKVIVKRADGTGAALRILPGKVEVQEYASLGEDIPGLEPVDADVGPLMEASGPWLRQEIEAYITEPWFRVVSVGVFLRHYWFDAPSDKKEEIVKLALKKQSPPHRRLVEDIVARWTPGQVETIIDRARSMAHLLSRRLQELEEECTPLDEAWRQDFVSACVRRDDLEGLREVLGILEREDLDLTLRALDENAMNFVSVVPVGLDPYNPRLLRAMARDGDVWWTWPVQDPSSFDLFEIKKE